MCQSSLSTFTYPFQVGGVTVTSRTVLSLSINKTSKCWKESEGSVDGIEVVGKVVNAFDSGCQLGVGLDATLESLGWHQK